MGLCLPHHCALMVVLVRLLATFLQLAWWVLHLVGIDLQVALPMPLYCQACAPQQASTFKLTINTNKPPPPLSALFEDVLAHSPQARPPHAACCLHESVLCQLCMAFLRSFWPHTV